MLRLYCAYIAAQHIRQRIDWNEALSEAQYSRTVRKPLVVVAPASRHSYAATVAIAPRSYRVPTRSRLW
jgi:hypothetical protein